MEAGTVYRKHYGCLVLTERKTSLREMIAAVTEEYPSLTLEEVGFPNPLFTFHRGDDLFVGPLSHGDFLEFDDTSQMSLYPKLSLASAMRMAKRDSACREDFGNVFFFIFGGTLTMIVRKAIPN